jgi:transposase
VVERGKTPTTEPGLTALVTRLRRGDEIRAGQEVGTMCYFVHDLFEAAHLICERRRWLLRAKASIRAAGCRVPSSRNAKTLYHALLSEPDGLDERLAQTLARCQRMHETLTQELKQLEETIRSESCGIDAISRLQTIPSVGEWTATTLYACVGDVSRFRSARHLAAYVDIVPSVWQSADSERTGGITKRGSPALRRMLTQAAHVLLSRCRSPEAIPLKEIGVRVKTSRKRTKIAVIAVARHILRIAYYVLRDETSYDPARLTRVQETAK